MSNRDMGVLLGLKPTSVWKLRRELVKPSLEVAVNVEKVTHGKVKPKDWFSGETPVAVAA